MNLSLGMRVNEALQGQRQVLDLVGCPEIGVDAGQVKITCVQVHSCSGYYCYISVIARVMTHQQHAMDQSGPFIGSVGGPSLTQIYM